MEITPGAGGLPFLVTEFSRRRLLRAGGGAVGGLMMVGLLDGTPACAHDRDASPKPIPGGFDANFVPVPSNPFIHVLPPAVGFDMSTITDFAGVIAAAEIQGTASGSDGSSYTFDADMRFMKGRYVATDGRQREASFGFV
jgi:hypothetical protein